MNVIDLFAIFPFYINLVLEGLEDFEIIGKTGKIIRLVSINLLKYQSLATKVRSELCIKR